MWQADSTHLLIHTTQEPYHWATDAWREDSSKTSSLSPQTRFNTATIDIFTLPPELFRALTYIRSTMYLIVGECLLLQALQISMFLHGRCFGMVDVLAWSMFGMWPYIKIFSWPWAQILDTLLWKQYISSLETKFYKFINIS